MVDICNGGAETPGLHIFIYSSTASVWPSGTVLDLRCDKCDMGAGTPGLPLHLPPVSGLQALYLIFSVTYVTGLLGPLVFLFIYRQCLACRYFYWSTVDICDRGAETPGLPLHLPPVSSLQVLLLIYSGHTVCNRGAETPRLHLHLPPVSCLQVLYLI
jgi:hypothetical protein